MKPITINLLGTEDRGAAFGLPDVGQLDLPLLAIVAVGLAAVLGVPPLAVGAVDTFFLNPATAKSQDLTRQIGRNKGASRELNRLEADLTARQHDLEQLEGIVGQGGGWAGTLEELRNLTPTDLWLTSFNADDKSVSLTGDALAYKDVAYFYTNLQNARKFSHPVLDNVSVSSVGTQQVVQFSLHASLGSAGGAS